MSNPDDVISRWRSDKKKYGKAYSVQANVKITILQQHAEYQCCERFESAGVTIMMVSQAECWIEKLVYKAYMCGLSKHWDTSTNWDITLHIISLCVSFLSRDDELNKLAGLQCMGVHSSAGRVLGRERRGHGFESRWSPEKLFFSGYFAIAQIAIHCDGHIFISFGI